MRFPHLVGKCFLCDGIVRTPYDPSENRFCCSGELTRDIRRSFGRDLRVFPTIYPIPRRDTSIFAPVDPNKSPSHDVFAVSRPRSHAPSSTPTPALPYTVTPELSGLSCGNATVYSISDLAPLFSFEPRKLRVCDLSTYLLSGTLKDPRSWAVINNAIELGIRHLGVWTAGNAGYSLSRLAYLVNRVRKPKDRIHVYCLHEHGSLDATIRRHLQSFGAHVVGIKTEGRGKILSPRQALQWINSSLGTKIDHSEYWDVTDGWDGVGLYMYRLLGRQLCLMNPRPKYIVAPIGTGDLFFGLYLGRQDALRQGRIHASDCRLVGALPLGESIRKNYAYYGLPLSIQTPADGRYKRVPPLASKLETAYTPLLLVMYKEMFGDPDRVSLLEVNREDQALAGALIYGAGPARLIATEPSALIAFAALSSLAALHDGEVRGKVSQAHRQIDAEVLVVNSGCGLTGAKEDRFLISNLRAFGAI